MGDSANRHAYGGEHPAIEVIGIFQIPAFHERGSAASATTAAAITTSVPQPSTPFGSGDWPISQNGERKRTDQASPRGREPADQVRGRGPPGRNCQREQFARVGRADGQREPAVEQAEHGERTSAAASRPKSRPRPTGPSSTASAANPTAQTITISSASADALGEHGVSAPQRVAQDQLEPPCLLLAREGPRTRADRQHEHEQRQHQAEELGVDEARARIDVAAAADAEERLERVGVVLDELVEVGRALDRREDRGHQRDVADDPDAPARARAGGRGTRVAASSTAIVRLLVEVEEDLLEVGGSRDEVDHP